MEKHGELYMQLGWIDFSREDRKKVFDVINLLQEPGAVDEIGIGPIRDAFANLFFPGTSTVQTIAKYFLIVPYILKEATEGRYGNDFGHILRRIDQEEKECGIRLMQNCPGDDGIIGRRVLPKGWVARKPSDIYWNGIRTYGICTQDLTISDLLKAALALKTQSVAIIAGNPGDMATGEDGDDTDVGKGLAAQLFSVPDDYYSDWRKNLSVRLTKSEAVFLREKIETNTSSSLLCYLLKNNVNLERYNSFEAIYADLHEALPNELRRRMELACMFNRLVYAARVRYNYVLSSGQNEQAVSEWTYVEENIPYITSVDIDDLMQTLDMENFRLRRFLIHFKMALKDGDVQAADDVLIHREIEIKTRSRAKLCRRDDFSNDTWIGGRWLDYRFSSAKRLISDIYQGEERFCVQNQ